jgi:hypothetical protein
MESKRQPWQTKALGASRVAGWVLGAGVLLLSAIMVVQFLAWTRDSNLRGRLEARAFIEKVRACHRAPPPHPTWPECERLVRSRE